MNKILLCFLTSVLSLFALTGCNTMDGLGEDTEKAGEEMQDAVDDATD